MLLIREKRSRSKTEYEIISGKHRRIVCTRYLKAIVASEDGGVRNVGVFYDAQWRILYAPSIFLIEEMRWDSENTRLQAVSALKLLISFSAITGVYPQDFEMSDAKAFVMFVKGTLGYGLNSAFELESIRSEATLAAYLAIIRRYVVFLGVEDSPFTKKREVRRKLLGNDNSKDDFVVSASRSGQDEVPAYISPAEYRKVISALDRRKDVAGKVIVRLMFEHGLRIGEVLGLTIEDVKMRISAGVPSYSVMLRNRTSDRPDQHAKSLANITSPAEYLAPEYRKRNVGYQEVCVSDSLYHELVGHIESEQPLVDRRGDRGNSAADAVDGAAANRYVFLNGRGDRLTANLWGRRLRAVFADVGIPADKDKRKANLNHRFRHGYAMFLINNERLTDFDVKVLMRHKSLRSTAIYHQPTEQDLFALQELVTKEMHELIFGSAGETQPEVA